MTPAERVARGAKLLDERRPGWWERVTEELVMASSCGCVLGQVLDEEADEAGWSGGYFYGVSELGPGSTVEDDDNWAFEHGFYSHTNSYAALALEWHLAIEQRRSGS